VLVEELDYEERKVILKRMTEIPESLDSRDVLQAAEVVRRSSFTSDSTKNDYCLTTSASSNIRLVQPRVLS
jgi:hypothetical protein